MAGSQPTPNGWGDDPLSEFIEMSRENDHATFVQMRGEYGVLLRVDRCFKDITENLNENTSLLSALLVKRAHGAYRAACRLAISGQVVDSFPVLRGCLETAMYCLHIDRHPTAGDIWMRRHDDAESTNACRREFTVGNVMTTWEAEDQRVAATARMLYERTIDFGAHPNERSLTASMIIEELEGATSFSHLLLTGNSLHIAHAMKTCAQVGVAALCAARLVFPQRFDILRISDRLDQLRAEL